MTHPGRKGKPATSTTLTVEDEVASVLADVDPLTWTRRRQPWARRLERWLSSRLRPVDCFLPTSLPDCERVAPVVSRAGLVLPEVDPGIDSLKAASREGLVRAVTDAKAQGTVITLPAPHRIPRASAHLRRRSLDDDIVAFIVDPVRCVTDTVHQSSGLCTWSMVVPVTYVLNERDRPVSKCKRR